MDLYLLAVPIIVISKVQMGLGAKIRICALFSIGSLSAIGSVMRQETQRVLDTNPPDPSRKHPCFSPPSPHVPHPQSKHTFLTHSPPRSGQYTKVIGWALLDLTSGVCAASLPIVSSYLTKVWQNRRWGSRSTRYRNNNDNTNNNNNFFGPSASTHKISIVGGGGYKNETLLSSKKWSSCHNLDRLHTITVQDEIELTYDVAESGMVKPGHVVGLGPGGSLSPHASASASSPRKEEFNEDEISLGPLRTQFDDDHDDDENDVELGREQHSDFRDSGYC